MFVMTKHPWPRPLLWGHWIVAGRLPPVPENQIVASLEIDMMPWYHQTIGYWTTRNRRASTPFLSKTLQFHLKWKLILFKKKKNFHVVPCSHPNPPVSIVHPKKTHLVELGQGADGTTQSFLCLLSISQGQLMFILGFLDRRKDLFGFT